MNPVCAIGAGKAAIGFVVVKNAAGSGVPPQATAQFHGEIGEQATCRRNVPLFDVGHRANSVAASGQEAVDLYKRHQADIEIVLLDVRMPGSLDGPQTLAALRELEPNVLCCFMSGQFGGYTEAGLRELGASRVIPKPFRLFEVAHVLRDLARTADLSRSGV